MLGTSVLSYKNTLSRYTQRIFIHLVLHVIVAILCNIKGFASAYRQPPFCTKRTLARIDYLRPSERLVNYKPLIMLKFIP